MEGSTHIPARTGALRSDAALNRARILDTARVLFAERGIDVPMSTIARRAGVGVATLFRRFPNRESLITQAFAAEISRCEAALEDAVADPDPWRGFCRLIEFVAATQIDNHGFTEAFLASLHDTEEVDERRSRAEVAFERLVRRAQQHGTLSPDFAPGDLTMFLLANGGFRGVPRERAHELSRRLVALLLRACATSDAAVRLRMPPPTSLGLDAVHAYGVTGGRVHR